MAGPTGTTQIANLVVPELFDEAVQAEFMGKGAFMGSGLAQAGAVIIRGSMPERGPGVIGKLVTVPYFESIGEMQDLVNDGDSLSPQQIGQTKEQASVVHSGIAMQLTTWAKSNPLGDVYAEGARQIMAAATVRMDRAIITAAVKQTTELGLSLDKFSAGRQLDYDLFVDAKMLFRDWQDDIAGVCVHSKTLANMYKLKDAIGRPLLSDPVAGGLPRMLGIPVTVSDRLPIATGSTMGAVTSVGTAPPVITLTGTPTRNMDLRVEAKVVGALGTSKIRWSVDGGATWVQDGTYNPYVTTAATLLMTDNDNVSTGVTLNIAAGAASLDNVWTAGSTNKYTSLIVKKGALAFWYNQAAIGMKQLEQPLNDSEITALHLYHVAHRYKRLRGTPLPGVVQILHA